MPKFSVNRSIIIKAPVEQVHEVVRDFKSWPSWSPWLIAEPDCPLTYADDGKSYRWDGEVVGSGEMQITGEAPERIDYRLSFFKPWKSESVVSFQFRATGDATEVRWTMDGSLPFFLFWMKPMMAAFVGSDYERGLKMLKDKLESGTVSSKLDFETATEFPGFSYFGLRQACTIDEIGGRMESDFAKLKALICDKSLEPSGPPFSIYHKWNVVKRRVEYTIGFPVASAPSDLPAEYVQGSVPACRTYRIRHIGAYHHLGNAWASGMMHVRGKRFTTNRGIHPFEIYENDPGETPEAELVTVVHMPAK